jgi:tripartite-type tricarboxylate transporter receptor subunit TctC
LLDSNLRTQHREQGPLVVAPQKFPFRERFKNFFYFRLGPHTRSGRRGVEKDLAECRELRIDALVVTTKSRSHLLPDVPTIAEAGVPGFNFPIWYGVWVPAGTPAGVVDKLAKDIARVMAAPELRAWLEEHGADRLSMAQPEFASFVVSESETAAGIAKAAGIKLQ